MGGSEKSVMVSDRSFFFNEKIAELVFRASKELETIGKIGYKTLQLIQQAQSLDGNPLYAILHEAIYCQGYTGLSNQPFRLYLKRGFFLCFFFSRRASRWSAERMISQHAPFSWSLVKGLRDDEPLFFTGEMVSVFSPPNIH